MVPSASPIQPDSGCLTRESIGWLAGSGGVAGTGFNLVGGGDRATLVGQQSHVATGENVMANLTGQEVIAVATIDAEYDSGTRKFPPTCGT